MVWKKFGEVWRVCWMMVMTTRMVAQVISGVIGPVVGLDDTLDTGWKAVLVAVSRILRLWTITGMRSCMNVNRTIDIDGEDHHGI